MVGQQGRFSLRPTELVHEAYLKLAVGSDAGSWESRTHFLAVAARAMRQILVDHARRKAAVKHGGGLTRVTLATNLGDDQSELGVLALDAALNHLAGQNERMVRVVELRVFAGMAAADIARLLGVSLRTVQSDWKVARVWLAHRMAS